VIQRFDIGTLQTEIKQRSHTFSLHIKETKKKPLVQEKTGAKEQYIVKMNLARPILRVRLQ
jgi:hypothetical protein